MNYRISQIIIFIVIITSNLYASDIPIHYVSPESHELLDDNSENLLKTRVINFITKHGISGDGGFSDIVIYPVVSLLSEDQIEGMKKLQLYKIEVQLIIKEVQTGHIYCSYSINTNGSGYDKISAVRSAISKINFNNKDGVEFISTGKDRILSYYQSNCAQLLSKANLSAKNGKYQEAIAICYSIISFSDPESLDCHQQALSLSERYYKRYQENTCKENILLAESFIVSRKVSDAIRVLSNIDPESSCYLKVNRKLDQIDQMVKDQEKNEREILLEEKRIAYEKYMTDASIERDRIEAIRDMSIEYYRNQTKTYQYNYIIR